MLVVQKYGGSSLQSIERIKRVAERVRQTRRDGHDVAVVCSAMGDTSDELIELAGQVSQAPPARELDMLLTTGERASNALLAMAVDALGVRARSFSGGQAGVRTDSAHGRARIVEVDPARIRAALDQGTVALVAGFQGISAETGDVTTLGRGGSDITAVALAAGLKADICEIYTDVDGVFSADPRVVPHARLLPSVSYEEMLEMAAGGAKILMTRCVEYARRHQVPLHVRSSYTDACGTFVTGSATEPTELPALPAPGDPASPVVVGIAHTRAVTLLTVEPVHEAGAAEIAALLARAGIPADPAPRLREGSQSAQLTFAVAESDARQAVTLLRDQQDRLGFDRLHQDTGFGRISAVGAGLRSRPDAVSTFFRTLAEAGIEVGFLSASGIRISGICRADQLEEAVRTLHSGFGLDSETTAAVYAGTGR
ncbi:aspartate kinase [Kitasatospora sp. MAP12-15]|nr:aspartate kinase [Kitasatospora sp. MAP12-44]